MGVWITPHMMPAKGHTLTHDDFVMMILRVMYEGHAQVPVTVASGLITHTFQRPEGLITFLGFEKIPKDIETFPHELAVKRYDALTRKASGDYGSMMICYHGDDREALVHALYTLPYGRDDIFRAIWRRMG